MHTRTYPTDSIEQSPHVESVALYLVKKLPAFCRTQRSVTILTKLVIVPVLNQINPVEAARYYSLRPRVAMY